MRGRMITGIKLLAATAFVYFFLLTNGSAGELKGQVNIYLDADFSNTATSSIAIEQGILTALSEVHNIVEGYNVVLVRKDHHGNSRRSLNNLKDYLKDTSALAVFSGLHSPPLLSTRDFINTNEILVLAPWAAAGPITRYPSAQNWIFRLSVDDTKAGFVLVDYAIKKKKSTQPALLLENTGWGKFNHKTMLRALADKGLSPLGVYWFNWGIQDRGARILLRSILNSGADSILLVANAPEAKSICRAIIELQTSTRIPVVSHWGLTGGDFPEVIHPALREKLDLNFLQTSFSFTSNPENPLGKQVFNKAKELFPESIKEVGDIKAPTGFIHGYDLTRLFLAAVKQAHLSGEIIEDRRRIRMQLENINEPIQGLIKTYLLPFQEYSQDNPDAHEALGEKDFVMGRFDDNNDIMLEQENPK